MMPPRLSSLPPSLSTFGADPDLDTRKKQAEERDRSHTLLINFQISFRLIIEARRQGCSFYFSIIEHFQQSCIKYLVTRGRATVFSEVPEGGYSK